MYYLSEATYIGLMSRYRVSGASCSWMSIQVGSGTGAVRKTPRQPLLHNPVKSNKKTTFEPSSIYTWTRRMHTRQQRRQQRDQKPLPQLKCKPTLYFQRLVSAGSLLNGWKDKHHTHTPSVIKNVPFYPWITSFRNLKTTNQHTNTRSSVLIQGYDMLYIQNIENYCIMNDNTLLLLDCFCMCIVSIDVV